MSDEYALLNDPEMKEILESFLEESKEILENLNSDLVELENSPNDEELLNKIFRAYHTLKGTSGFLGLVKTTKVTHKCEDILNKLRKGTAKLSPELMDILLNAYDVISNLTECIEENKNEDVEIDSIVDLLVSTIESLDKGEEIGKTKKKSKKKSKSKKSDIQENEQSPTESDDVDKQIEELIKANKLENLQKSKNSKVEKSEPDDGVENAPADNSAGAEKIIEKNLTKKGAETTIRVEVERLDDLLNIVSELVLGRNQLQQVHEKINNELEGTETSRLLSEATKQIDLMTNELQSVVMKTRMVKIGKVFNKFPRLVRDLSRETSKNIDLVINGQDTELDKTLIEEINDPLVHLIRNSIDHGIENPEDRKALGKSEKGTIKLEAYPEGNNIVIAIKDDGKGIDADVIKAKAIEKGLISADKAEELSRQEIFNLIFLPGFSTAAKVTNISGRGVGMDVVKTNVKNLRGIINIDSDVNVGTTITIKLPLTLAIISGMIVRVGAEFYIIPISNILEVVKVHCEDISSIKGQQVIRVREDVIPLVSIDEMIKSKSNTSSENVWNYVVIVGIAENKYGIKVDETIGQKEIVIKSLGSYLGKIPGIAGSTIMGDGTVVMIVDLAEIINTYVGNIE